MRRQERRAALDIEKLRDLADDPRFISGVYNYCDRWCERCPFTSRCLTHAMGADEDDADLESRDVDNAKFWDRLHGIFEMTRRMIEETAGEIGIDLEAVDVEAGAEDREVRLSMSSRASKNACARRAPVSSSLRPNDSSWPEKYPTRYPSFLKSSIIVGCP